MKRRILRILAMTLGVIFLIIFAISAFVYFGLSGIPESNIVGNVPDQAVFGQYLSRDLNTYFEQNLNKKIQVSYELLRNGPTQVGVAYPKFYAWVVVKDESSNKILNQGAVLLAAVNKEEFNVMEFASLEEIKSTPQNLQNIFPQEVVAKIQAKVANPN